MKKFTAIDLFCGAGGVSQALKQYFDVMCAVEYDPIIATTYQLNHPSHKLLVKDITQISEKDWLHEVPIRSGELDLLIGTPPCQGYSKHSRKKSSEQKDERNDLIFQVLRVARLYQPKYIFFENVTNIVNFKSFRVFLKGLANIRKDGTKRDPLFPSYHIRFENVDSSNYNVPQKRKRMILIAKRIEKFPELNAYVGEMKSKQKRLPFIEKPLSIWPAEKKSPILREYFSPFQLPYLEAGSSSPDDPLHTCRGLNKKNLERLSFTPPNGGSRKDWPDHLQLDCHKKDNVSFGDVYGRIDSYNYAPTITCGCLSYSKGRFGHWEENRAISLREAALIQTFPLNYKFTGTIDSTPFRGSKEQMAKQIGNAVPVQLALAFVEEFYKQLLIETQ